MSLVTTGFLEAEQREAVSVEEMKRIEDLADSIGISRMLMMENAGGAIAWFVAQNFDYIRENHPSRKFRALLVAGTGNNGGDVFVAARHLSYWMEPFEIIVLLIGDPGDIRAEEARTNFRILEKVRGITIIPITSEESFLSISPTLMEAGVIVAGIFGTGFKGEPRPLQKKIMETINETESALKISVDLPSGLEADSGNFSTAIQSDITITMHAAKIGMLKNPRAKKLCGLILVANIGVPP